MIYDIQDTESLVHAMHSEEVWKTYEARLPETRKHAFGDYCIEGAAQKTALLILKAFRQGTFGKDASMIRIKPEWLEANQSATFSLPEGPCTSC